MSERDQWDEKASRLLDVIYNVIDAPREEAEREAAKFKSEDDMYGWNFYKGRESGMTEVDLSVREALRPAVASAFREMAEQLKAEVRDEIEMRDYCTDQTCHCRSVASDIARRLELPELGASKIEKLRDELDGALIENERLKEQHKAEVERLKIRPTLISSTCVYLSDGNKVVVNRDGKRAWLEVVPQDRIGLQQTNEYRTLETIEQLQEDLTNAEAEIARLKQALNDAQQEPRK